MRHTLTTLLATDQEEQTALISAALVKRVANGDESAFATLYDTTCGLIYGLLLRILGDSESAGQILMTVYQEVWERAATCDDAREKPMTWLITMAHRNAIAQRRADNQEQEYQTCGLLIAARAVTSDSERDGMISDEQGIVRLAVATLSSVQQQILELAYFSGLCPNEIAARLGLSLHSVQTGTRDGMMSLRAGLSPVSGHHLSQVTPAREPKANWHSITNTGETCGIR